MRLPSSRWSRGVADVDRDHRSQASGGRRLAARDEQVAQRCGDEGEDDVVDGAAQRALDRLELLQRHLRHRDPAVLAERDVEARLRRGDELVAHEQLDEGPGGVEPLGRTPGMAHEVDGRLGGGQRQGRETTDGARPVRLDGRRRRRSRPASRGLRLGVEQHAARIDRADAVDEAMVRLGDQGPAPAGESLQQDHAPQRAAAVEAVRPEVGRPGQQLALAARLGQRGAGDVGGDVEALVGHPGRPVQATGGAAREPLAVTRQLVEAALEVPSHPRQRGCAAAAGADRRRAALRCACAP